MMRKVSNSSANHHEMVDSCLYLLKNIDSFYHAMDTAKKQRLMGSIFPEKLYFENNQVRTTRINEMVLTLCRNNRAYSGDKEKQRTIFDALPSSVGATGFEPVTLAL